MLVRSEVQVTGVVCCDSLGPVRVRTAGHLAVVPEDHAHHDAARLDGPPAVRPGPDVAPWSRVRRGGTRGDRESSAEVEACLQGTCSAAC